MTDAEKKKAAKCKELAAKLKAAKTLAANKERQLARANADVAKFEKRLADLGCE